MNYLLSLVFVIGGVVILLKNKSLAVSLGNFTARRHKATFGRLAHYLGWDNPNKPSNILLHRILIIFCGFFLIILAFHFFFGTVYIGSAQPTGSLLEVQ